MAYLFKTCSGFDSNPLSSATKYVIPYNGPDDSNKDVLSRGAPNVIFADKKHTTCYVNNPVLTDTSQVKQTDLKHILASNPDVNGLSLLVNDSAANYDDYVSIEDFMEPSNYVDIFDVYDFVNRSKASFAQLPASFRKMYNNDPAVLCRALNDDKTSAAVIDSLSKYLDVSAYQSDNSGTPSVDRDNVSETQPSDDKGIVNEKNVSNNN